MFHSFAMHVRTLLLTVDAHSPQKTSINLFHQRHKKLKMNFLRKIFRKKTSVREVILKLRLTEDMLTRKQNILKEIVKREALRARRTASTNKNAAIRALQRKKRLDHQLQNIDEVLTTLKRQRKILQKASTRSLPGSSMKGMLKTLKGRVFGKKSTKTPTLPEAIMKLRHTEDILTRKQNNLEEKIKKEIATARKNASVNKKAAIQALQRKKRLELELQKIDGVLTTLEGQRELLENANTNALAVSSMKEASEALKGTHKDLDISQVEKILDDLAEHKEISDEISEVISHPIGFEDNVDEDELERELKDLEGTLKEIAIDELPSVPQEDIMNKSTLKTKRGPLVAS